ncbi:MAG: helix-turn-helix domain-containing protein [Pseudobdellovibrio sp.]
MEKLSITKTRLEEEINELGHANQNKNIVSVGDFNLFKQTIKDLLENESSPEIKSQIIQKVVDKIIVKPESIEIYFFVGESHYKKEINIHNQQGASANSLSLSEKRHTTPLPVFHGNRQTSEFLNLKPNVASNNFYDAGSNSLKIGSLNHSLPEHLQIHKKIELSSFDRQVISETYSELYCKGLSLSDISKQTGKSKSVIQRSLTRAGIELRSNVAVPISKMKTEGGKTNIRPPYGFCYFRGQIVPDQNEYENLMLIYRLWKANTNPNRISDQLNKKKIAPRIAKYWNRNSVANIITRFEQKQIVFKGGQLELR